MLYLLLACANPEPTDPNIPGTCNGHAELCDRTFDTVTLAGTHNSMSNSEDGFTGAHHPSSYTGQLNDGVRAMMLATHTWQGQSVLCDEACEFGFTPLVDALTDVREFLDANRGEVMAFVIKNAISSADTEAAFVAAGLDKYLYVWKKGDDWPTLAEMITADRRLLVVAETGGNPAWYHAAWELYAESTHGAAGSSCEVNNGSLTNPLFLLNQWVDSDFPSETAAEINSASAIAASVESCSTLFGKNPNIVAVDWYTTGDLMAAVDTLNGL